MTSEKEQELMDNRVRPVYVSINNKRVLVISNGKGDVAYPKGEGYEAYLSKFYPENIIPKGEYVYERGLTSFDF